MSWRCSAESNEDMVRVMRENGVITTPSVMQAFRLVDRKIFVPKGCKVDAYKDYPIKKGPLHMSAPHMYGTILESLEVEDGHSFLNLGGGTGYMSCLVGAITGKHGINHAVDIEQETVTYARDTTANYMALRKRDRVSRTSKWTSDNPEHEEDLEMNKVDNQHEEAYKSLVATAELPSKPLFLCENAFYIDVEKNMKYDRIYIGAAAPKSFLMKVAKLLKPHGVLVAPSTDKLLKVRADDQCKALSETAIAHVLFTQMTGEPTEIIERRVFFKEPVWTMSNREAFPDLFNQAVELILSQSKCSNTSLVCVVPTVIWEQIFSFMSMEWFRPPMTEVEHLKRCVETEVKFREEAQARVEGAEEELAKFRIVALHQQRRIRQLLQRLREDFEEAGSGDGNQRDLRPRDLLLEASRPIRTDDSSSGFESALDDSSRG